LNNGKTIQQIHHGMNYRRTVAVVVCEVREPGQKTPRTHEGEYDDAEAA
jgi:hypothetical protein